MGRRVTNGTVGSVGLGNFTVSGTTLVGPNNSDIVLDPVGTGVLRVAGDAQLNAQGDLRFGDADSSNWVAFQGASTISSNVTWTLPATDGSNGQSLTTNGSGTLGWATNSVTISDQNSTASDHYVLFTTTTSGTASTVNVGTTKLRYRPDTGSIIMTTLTGNSTSGGTLTLRSTSNATKGYVYIDETTASTSTTTGALRIDGGVGIGGTLYVSNLIETSTIAVKENVNPISDALNIVSRLSGVTYDRTDTVMHEAGLIAEEVEKILPYMVARDENGRANGVKYSKLTAYLIEAIKILKMEVDQLKGSK
jgi:hypothetical protein